MNTKLQSKIYCCLLILFPALASGSALSVIERSNNISVSLDDIGILVSTEEYTSNQFFPNDFPPTKPGDTIESDQRHQRSGSGGVFDQTLDVALTHGFVDKPSIFVQTARLSASQYSNVSGQGIHFKSRWDYDTRFFNGGMAASTGMTVKFSLDEAAPFHMDWIGAGSVLNSRFKVPGAVPRLPGGYLLKLIYNGEEAFTLSGNFNATAGGDSILGDHVGGFLAPPICRAMSLT